MSERVEVDDHCDRDLAMVLSVSRVLAVMFKEIKEFREIHGNANYCSLLIAPKKTPRAFGHEESLIAITYRASEL
jgi:hypothetical protein